MTAFSKNLLLALIPLALAAVGYLFQASIAMHDKLSVMEQKMSILVDMDNKIIPSPDNAIARNQIRMELQDDLHDLDKRLSLLEAIILGKK